jgi:hypothetical protein
MRHAPLDIFTPSCLDMHGEYILTVDIAANTSPVSDNLTPAQNIIINPQSASPANTPASFLLMTPSSPRSPEHPKPSASTATVNTTNPAASLTLFTYRVQLTFGLAVCKEVNIANLFTQWFESTQRFLHHFALLPYESEKGPTITLLSQLTSADEAVFHKYYSNHRILQHGKLTGMVQFQTSSPWRVIKGYKSPYFSWLKYHRVFITYTKFKTDTLVVCGFLLGAHPGHLRHDEAKEEFRGSLSMDSDDLPFQLSSRTISVL